MKADYIFRKLKMKQPIVGHLSLHSLSGSSHVLTDTLEARLIITDELGHLALDLLTSIH
jgi:hypothetical protein